MAILAQRAREAGRLLSSLVLRKERAVSTWEQQEDAFMEGAKLVAGLNMAERSRMAHETEEKAMGELFDEEDIPRWRRGGRRHEDYPDSMEAEAHAPALFAAKPATELTPQDVALTSALQRLALDDDAGDHAASSTWRRGKEAHQSDHRMHTTNNRWVMRHTMSCEERPQHMGRRTGAPQLPGSRSPTAKS